MLDCYYHVRPIYPCTVQSSHLSKRDEFVRETLASLKSFLITLFCRSEIIMRTAINEVGRLKYDGDNWTSEWQGPSGNTYLLKARWLWFPYE